MGDGRGVLLTGATGFLGRYLLGDLLAAGQRVVVLARPRGHHTADERVGELLAECEQTAGRRLPRPTVLTGDLVSDGLGLSQIDVDWLTRCCGVVLHAAAQTTLCRSADGEPWRTNVEGTRNLLELCGRAGISDVHYVSTAFVCGKQRGTIHEDHLDGGQGFHNDYERSKWTAERLVRRLLGIRATIYRPSVIVGDSRTGRTTTYQGFYRVLELADRLARPNKARAGYRTLPLALPLTGEERRNLVPVDWVSAAITRLVTRSSCHGRTYHLVAAAPTLGTDIKEAVQEVLKVDGVSWAGSATVSNRPVTEPQILEHLGAYRPYLSGDPDFDCCNTRLALPDLPPPRVDHAVLCRLLRFAVADRWGRRRNPELPGGCMDCARYVEEFFPIAARRSVLSRLPVDVVMALEVQGTGGGRWWCHWCGGVMNVRRGRVPNAAVEYRMDTATFAAIVEGRLTAQEAFFARRIEIVGDVEKALKLAVFFDHFAREFPYLPLAREAVDVLVRHQ